ncbi:MAG: type I-E CRISPR-associated protein Cse1/CasA [Erysipelotrichaceae bacterium]|mgnify:CR=1 FL=1|nr:type I-E CRISPR-associated protein Cse1/CasA [Erysipelotrichaceae bacterium]
MGRYNLLDEAWISVVIDEKGNNKEVSLKELFKNAHLYKDLAGDTRTQDFAILRVILAIIYTVFSRFNNDGEVYQYLEVDKKYRQISNVEDEDLEEYTGELLETWFNVWNKAQFPSIINEYLEIWRDRFYLFDEKYPFFQVTKEDIEDIIDLNKTSGTVHGKNINRKLSESANKLALFSYKYNKNNNKEMLTESEIIRWLLTYQGYSGTGDKVKFNSKIKTYSKGWLYDIGGIYLKGNNLFETLMLNWAILYDGNMNGQIQKPCWEYNSEENIKSYINGEIVNNISRLYTSWSRGIYIDSNYEISEPFSIRVGKLPEIDHKDTFIEPMTIWKYNEKGDYKDSHTPIKHKLNESMWRSFGLFTFYNKLNNRVPGIIDWITKINQINNFPEINVTLAATSMEDDGNATSWVPTNEIIDNLSISNYVLTDLKEDGWIVRINDAIEMTKNIISVTYKKYVQSIQKIRNISNNEFVDRKIEDMYHSIDMPFRQWISNIRLKDNKDNKILEWKNILEKHVKEQAKNDIYYANYRDYIGIEKDGEVFNIASAYNIFNYYLNLKLK